MEKQREQDINSYYYNTIFFLRKLLHPKEGSETMLPAKVTICVRVQGQQ